MDDRTKSIIDRVMEATDRVQQEVAARPVVSATKERAIAVRQRAQTAALSTLHLATREDVARMQASLDRIEAALNDISKRLPQAAAKPRASRSKPAAREAKSA
jgi:glutamyl-tRNA reductase